MSDTKALQDRIAELEARLARLEAPQHLPLPPTTHPAPPAPPPPKRYHVHLAGLEAELNYGHPHRLTMREVRMALEGVGWCLGFSTVGAEFPQEVGALVRKVMVARQEGKPWLVALVGAGLTPPSPDRIRADLIRCKRVAARMLEQMPVVADDLLKPVEKKNYVVYEAAQKQLGLLFAST